MQKLKKLSILASYSGQGGVEVVTNKLCQGLLNSGIEVDLLMVKCRGPHAKNIPNGVNKIKFKISSSALCVAELAAYLKQNQPGILLAAKHRGVKLALQARKKSKTNTKISGQIHTNTSLTFIKKSWFKRHSRFKEMRNYYSQLDSLIGVSQGVIDDIEQIIGKLPTISTALANPLFDDSIYQAASEPVSHQWIDNSGVNITPVIMSAGRLTEQKDFATLVRAFGIVRQSIPARLIIIGEGEFKSDLLNLANDLRIQNNLAFVDFQTNLPAWLNKCDVFVCSSAWEGLGNVVAESLALGKPIVSTDCISGPRYILEEGQFGDIVPVGDFKALAEKITAKLKSDTPQDIEAAKVSAKRFHLDVSTQSYIEHFEHVLNH